jgi:hypothetical protein
MPLRFSMPLVTKRGAGLGNELITWAKAYVGARALGIRALHPAWGLNRRRYWTLFGTSRSDWFVHKAVWHGLPHFEFRENDLDRAAGETLHDAVLRFAEKHDLRRRRAYVLGFSGLWGEYSYIVDARSFLRGQLLSTVSTADNLYEIERRMPRDTLKVGMHVRRGDFAPPRDGDAYRGQFNVATPLEWYERITRRLKAHFGERVTFLVVSDAKNDELGALTRDLGAITTSHQRNRDASDLLALSDCDFLICSVSSYSQWAALFSSSRYAWLKPNLTEIEGYGSIWGHQPRQAGLHWEIGRSIRHNHKTVAAGGRLAPRGIPVDWDGVLPDEALDDLEKRLLVKQSATDIIQHGAAPAGQRH